MRILFHLGHPAHYHLFIPIIKKLLNNGHQIKITIKSKDVLENLLIENQYDYINIDQVERNKNGYTAIIKKFLIRFRKVYKIFKNFNPNISVSCAPEVAQVARILNKPSLILFEDDLNQVKNWAKATAPFASFLICPQSCSVGNWDYKTIKYNGYHELTYLMPDYFSPAKLKNTNGKYFILRFSKLDAYHDVGKTGITKDLAYQLINKLKSHGKILISSEKQLEPEFEKYRISFPVSEIHHALYYADMYIGDSQTMAAEAAVLGTPSLRFNDFVGKLGYLEELEHKYGLTYGIKTDQPEKLLQKVDEILKMPDSKTEWANRREQMLKEKINVTDFMVWLIENYPSSVKTMRENPDYQYNFK